jgi:predicted nucleic acid-binding protein
MGPRVLISFDTSGIFALLNRSDPDHESVGAVLSAEAGPYLVPAGILAEVTYLVERRLGLKALDTFLADLEQGGFFLECGQNDFARIRVLAKRYANIGLGFADSCVIACAERYGGKGPHARPSSLRGRCAGKENSNSP